MGRNNHARTKKKKILLKLKSFFKRVQTKRLLKIDQLHKPKGKTLVGGAKEFAHHVPRSVFLSGSNHGRFLNQRQKRKITRQTGSYKK